MKGERAPGGLGRVLIVDDEPLNIDYLEQELESLGYETESATTGVEALEKVAASPPDVVLLDVMMPQLDGIATLRILKQDPQTRFVPVLLMTALNAVEDRVRGIEAGADDFLSKPVDDRELLARIRTAIARKRAIDETVQELRSTDAHLARFGRQERDIAVLAVAWRTGDEEAGDVPAERIAQRQREAIEEHVGAHLGVLSEDQSDATLVLATFDGSDSARRATAAVEAALAIIEHNEMGDRAHGDRNVHAAVAAGRGTVGSTKIERRRGPRWVWTADGPAVERATTLVRDESMTGLVVSDDVAATLSDRYVLEPVGDRVYAVVARAEGDLLQLDQPLTAT